MLRSSVMVTAIAQDNSPRYPPTMRRSLAVAVLLALTSCDTAAITWTDPAVITSPATGARLVIDAQGSAAFVPDSQPNVTVPDAPGLCRSSLRIARGSSHVYAVWWGVRPDSSGVLYAASSADSGKTWGSPMPVDTADVSSRGCSRPPASLATSGDDLHIAYSMIASEGTGVFFAHFMGSMLHSPVSVIYGERLVATAIAAEGDRVAVAYEEPNGSRQQVDVAISTTQGHIFERHEIASREVDAA